MKAVTVAIWLGQSGEESNLAMTTLARISPSWDPDRYHDPISSWSSEGEAIKNLCAKPYWTRVWIVQEIMMGSDIVVLCGRESIHWQLLTNAFARHDALMAFRDSCNYPASRLIHQKSLWNTC